MKFFIFVFCKYVYCQIFFNVLILFVVFQFQGYEIIFNIGWSFVQNSEGDRVFFFEVVLVIVYGKNIIIVKINIIIFFLERFFIFELYIFYDIIWSLFVLYNIKMLIEINLLVLIVVKQYILIVRDDVYVICIVQVLYFILERKKKEKKIVMFCIVFDKK